MEQPPLSFAERFTDWRKHYMPLPDEVVDEYLGEDEYVIHSDHPSFRAFLIKNTISVLIATALLPLVFAFVKMDLSGWWILLIVLGLDLVLLFLAVKRLGDRYTSYVITNLRLIRVSGIIGRRLASIPWTRMTGLGYRQKPMGRLMGFATIFIESANEESGLREFSDINDPAAFHQLILDMVSAKGGTKPEGKPTKGVRKTLWQRRRDNREAQRRESEAKIAEAREDMAKARAEASKPPVTDPAGPAEAMSTSDTIARPAPKPKAKPAPPRRPRSAQPTTRSGPPPTPPSGTPTVRPGPRRPPPPSSGPSRQRISGSQPTRPTSWPGPTRQPRQVPANPISEPWLTRFMNSPFMERLRGAAGRGEPDPTEPTQEQVSARDAIGAVRRGGRAGRTGGGLRRPRFPTFGRSRPTIPPSRQLPPGSSPPAPSDEDDEDD